MSQQVFEIEMKNAVRSALLKLGMDAIRNSQFFGMNESEQLQRLAA